MSPPEWIQWCFARAEPFSSVETHDDLGGGIYSHSLHVHVETGLTYGAGLPVGAAVSARLLLLCIMVVELTSDCRCQGLRLTQADAADAVNMMTHFVQPPLDGCHIATVSQSQRRGHMDQQCALLNGGCDDLPAMYPIVHAATIVGKTVGTIVGKIVGKIAGKPIEVLIAEHARTIAVHHQLRMLVA